MKQKEENLRGRIRGYGPVRTEEGTVFRLLLQTGGACRAVIGEALLPALRHAGACEGDDVSIVGLADDPPTPDVVRMRGRDVRVRVHGRN